MPTIKSLNRYFVYFLAGATVNGILLFAVLPSFLDTFHLYNANGFPDGYDKLARSLANGDGYKFFPYADETILRTPVYPIILALLFKVFGESLLSVQIFNFILTIIIAWLTSLLINIISQSSKTLQILAPLVVFLHPGIIISETRGGVEITLTLGIMISIILLVLAVKKHNIHLYFLSGLALGITALVKSTPLLFIAILFPYLLYKNRKSGFVRNTAIPMLLIFSGTAVALSPWIYRNYTISNQIIPTMTVLGTTITIGQHLCENLTFDKNPGTLISDGNKHVTNIARSNNFAFTGSSACCGPFFNTTIDEVRFSNMLTSTALRKYIENPIFSLRCAATNAVGFWFFGKSHTSTLLNLIVQFPFIAISIFGALRFREHNSITLLIIGFIIFYYTMHLPIFGLARYSIPLVPLISIFTANGIVIIRDLIYHKERTHISPVYDQR
jgi:hypothetical protein